MVVTIKSGFIKKCKSALRVANVGDDRRWRRPSRSRPKKVSLRKSRPLGRPGTGQLTRIFFRPPVAAILPSLNFRFFRFLGNQKSGFCFQKSFKNEKPRERELPVSLFRRFEFCACPADGRGKIWSLIGVGLAPNSGDSDGGRISGETCRRSWPPPPCRCLKLSIMKLFLIKSSGGCFYQTVCQIGLKELI